MAARSATLSGTSAYELEHVGAIPEIPLERPRRRVYPETGKRVKVNPQTEERLREWARERSAARTVTKQSVSPFAVVGFFCIGIMLVILLASYIQLTELSAESARLETELSELNDTAQKLNIAYTSAFNMAEIESYARNNLGMSEPSSSQIYYLESQSEDRSYILVTEGDGRDFGILTTIMDFFSSLRP